LAYKTDCQRTINAKLEMSSGNLGYSLILKSKSTEPNTPFKRSSWLDELAWRAGYMLAGRASSMFARSCKQSTTQFSYSICYQPAAIARSLIVYISAKQWLVAQRAEHATPQTLVFHKIV